MSPISIEALRAAYGLGLSTTVYTSGLGRFLTIEHLPDIVFHSRRLRFSISAATSATYRMVQVPQMPQDAAGEAFARVRKLMRTAAQLADGTNTRVGQQFLLQGDNNREWLDALAYAAQAGAKFFDLRLDVVPERTLQSELLAEISEAVATARGWFPTVDLELRENNRNHLAPLYCHAWKTSLVVDAFGGVHVCCIVADQPAHFRPFGLGYVRSGDNFSELIDTLEHTGVEISQCAVCADRTWVFNAAIEARGRQQGSEFTPFPV